MVLLKASEAVGEFFIPFELLRPTAHLHHLSSTIETVAVRQQRRLATVAVPAQPVQVPFDPTAHQRCVRTILPTNNNEPNAHLHPPSSLSRGFVYRVKAPELTAHRAVPVNRLFSHCSNNNSTDAHSK